MKNRESWKQTQLTVEYVDVLPMLFLFDASIRALLCEGIACRASKFDF